MEIKKQISVHICDSCKEEITDWENCFICNREVCSSCRTYHAGYFQLFFPIMCITCECNIKRHKEAEELVEQFLSLKEEWCKESLNTE
jgi:hypothetical protein